MRRPVSRVSSQTTGDVQLDDRPFVVVRLAGGCRSAPERMRIQQRRVRLAKGCQRRQSQFNRDARERRHEFARCSGRASAMVWRVWYGADSYASSTGLYSWTDPDLAADAPQGEVGAAALNATGLTDEFQDM